MVRPLSRMAVVSLVLAAGAAGASCQDPTQLTVSVSTNAPYRANVTTLAMWSSASGSFAPGAPAQVTYADAWGPDGRLGDLVVTPSGSGKDQALALRVVLGIGRDPATCTDADSKGCIVARRKLAFVPHTRLRVPMVLWLACEGVVCSEDTTCDYVGKCIPAAVDPGLCSSPEGCVLAGDDSLKGVVTDAGSADASVDVSPPVDAAVDVSPPVDASVDVSPPLDAADAAVDAPVDAPVDAGLGPASPVSAGWRHTCQRRPNGTIACWGSNTFGQLGDGTFTDRLTPTQIGVDADWAEVESGDYHTCARRNNGSLWCWGWNLYGALGVIGPTESATPVRVNAATDWASLAPGAYHTCARKTNGTLWCWGSNQYGELGDGTTMSRTPPAQVGAANDWVEAASGDFHTCARKTNNTLWCWGQNNTGQLGDGTSVNRSIPTQVTGDWARVVPGDSHTCAIRTNGSLACWGNNTNGQLGDGTTLTRALPLDVGLFSAVSGGWGHACAIRGGALYCWGYNADGQVGDGSRTDRSVPTQIGAATDWSAVSAGDYHTCATRTSGAVWCWGSNTNGQLGDNSTTLRTTPVLVP